MKDHTALYKTPVSFSGKAMSLSGLTRQSLLIAFLLLLTACSSAPKRAMQVSTVYSTAAELIQTSNAAILSGDLENASLFLTAAENHSMSIDNNDLLCSVALTRCALCLSYNPPKIEAAENQVALAKSYINKCSNPQKQASIVSLSEVRVLAAKGEGNTSSMLSTLENAQKGVKGDPYYEAQFSQVKGDVYKLAKNYEEADKAYTGAAKSFIDNRYLSEIGICWYKAAQARSMAGNKEGALEAMENAIYYDRAAENSLGLGADYYAVGLILIKGSPSQEEKNQAKEAFNHSADIYTSIKASELADRSREAADEL